MSNDNKLVTIKFSVIVSTDIIPPVFTYINSENFDTNGSVTTYVGEETHIIYTLKDRNLSFTDPAITNNFNGDISYLITTEKYNNDTLTIIDNGNDAEVVGLQLIIKNSSTGQLYASPDPQIISKRRG